MKYFRTLNSRAVSTTGGPLQLTSTDQKLTITSPNTNTLSAALKQLAAWPNSPSNLVDSEVSVRDLPSVISRTASFLMVVLWIRTMTGRKRDKLLISSKLMEGIRASDSSTKRTEVGAGTETCAN